MAKDNQIAMPGVFGGLMRYNEEYDSKIKFKPWHIIAFIVVLAMGIIVLKIIYPITTLNLDSQIPIPIGRGG